MVPQGLFNIVRTGIYDFGPKDYCLYSLRSTVVFALLSFYSFGYISDKYLLT